MGMSHHHTTNVTSSHHICHIINPSREKGSVCVRAKTAYTNVTSSDHICHIIIPHMSHHHTRLERKVPCASAQRLYIYTYIYIHVFFFAQSTHPERKRKKEKS